MSILVLPRLACQQLLCNSILPWDGHSHLVPDWRDRSTVESDPTWLQVIPYAVLIDPVGRPWAYQRTGGDGRLHQRRSIGVGGHIERQDDHGDLLAIAQTALMRELAEELVTPPSIASHAATPVAWINEQDSAIGQVHLGLVFALPWILDQAPCPRPGEGLAGLGFVEPDQITAANGYETWSTLAWQAIEAAR